MKSIITLIFLIAISNLLNGQNIGFEYGAMWIPQKSTSELHPDLKSTKTMNSSQNFFQLNYEQQIKKGLYINANYSEYVISTDMNFYRGEHTSSGIGWIGTKVTRVDLNLMYNFFYKKRIIVQPYGGLGVLRSNSRNYGFEGGLLRSWIESSQPNIEVLKDLEGNGYSNFQIVPVVGMKLGYAFWGRFELFIDVKGVFGHKDIQDLEMTYSYKGIKQPAARYYADGSGWFLGYGIGYRIVKAK